jgi:hypothetical protein
MFGLHCGTVLERDHNAALNILAKGLNRVGHTQINACGEFDLCQVGFNMLIYLDLQQLLIERTTRYLGLGLSAKRFKVDVTR